MTTKFSGKNHRNWTFCAVLVVLLLAVPAGAIKPAKVLDDGMVLQRGTAVPIWGKASSGQTIKVSFGGQTVKTTAGSNGHWMVKLEPFQASDEGRPLIIEGEQKITFEDVVVGEVWLASGQSNMVDNFGKRHNFPDTYMEKDLSGLRFSTRKGWFPVSKRDEYKLSRVAFYYACELYQALDIPIGMVLRARNGSPIQTWLSEEAAASIRKKLEIPADWKEGNSSFAPGQQFGFNLEPVIPYAIRGAIWYQGERNAFKNTAYEYDHLLAKLIEFWRGTWAQRADEPLRKFPFYYVQVPAQRDGSELPWLRDRMRRALSMTENTGMAIVLEYGPAVHPSKKKPVGRRLALWSLAKDYGRDDIVYSGPLLEDVVYKDGSAILTFRHVGSGLESKNGNKKLRFFEIAGKDGKYVSAKAEIIDEETVRVESPKVSDPAHVRYMFRQGIPEVSLINSEGLPASSFMTDDRKPSTRRSGD